MVRLTFENPKWWPGGNEPPYITINCEDEAEAEELQAVVEDCEALWSKKAFIRSLYR